MNRAEFEGPLGMPREKSLVSEWTWAPELREAYRQEREVCDVSAWGWHWIKCAKVCG